MMVDSKTDSEVSGLVIITSKIKLNYRWSYLHKRVKLKPETSDLYENAASVVLIIYSKIIFPSNTLYENMSVKISGIAMITEAWL